MHAVTLFLIPALLVGPAADAPPPSAAALDALVRRMGGGDAGDRLAAAQALAQAPASGFKDYVARLQRARTTPAATYRALILEAWGQVPNPAYAKDGNLWLRKPDEKPAKVKKGQPRPRRPPPHDPETTEWLAALSALDVDGNPVLAALPDRAAARAEALEVVGLLRAIGATRRDDAVGPIFDFAFALDGVFRDECGRALRAMESAAVPALIARMRATGKGVEAFRRRRYASYQLDRMDRAQPIKAIRTAPDDRLRAAIIHAYGEARAIDAVEAILDQVDAPSGIVRREARWAWLRYVTGPAPPPPPRRHRKLAGGSQESDEKEDYLSHRELALLALTRKLAAIQGDPDCERCRRGPDHQLVIPTAADAAEAMTREVFAHDDQLRAATWSADFEAARARADRGDLDGAIAVYRSILARDPLYGRRAEIAEAFYRRGEALAGEGHGERAQELLREAVLLDGRGARARHAEATLHLIEARLRVAAGRDPGAELDRALELSPESAEVRRLRDAREGGAGRLRRQWQGALLAGAVLGIGLLAVLIVRGRRRPVAGPRSADAV